MSEYGRGKGMNFFMGEVVNIDSPNQDGGVQVRAYGTQDNTSAIPDEQLRWHRVMMPATQGQVPGSSGTHGLMKGSRVIGFYLDDDEQIPIILGTITASGQSSGS